MIIIVDRIEGEYAVVEKEDLSTISVPVSILPDCKEGNIYEITKREDIEETRREKVRNLFDSLKK